MTSIYEERVWLKHYPAGMQHDYTFPDDKTLGQLFDETSEKWKSKTALIFYGNKISYKELREKVDRLANGFHALGIEKGDRVGVLLLNSPEYVYCAFALMKCGAIQVPISPVYVSSEIKQQLNDSECAHLICQDILWEGVEKTGYKFKNVFLTNISDSLPKLKKALGKSILRGVYQKMSAPAPEIFKHEGMHTLQEVLDKYPPEAPKVSINPKTDLYLLPYTGGTTGPPKGVMLTHNNMIVGWTLSAKNIFSMLEDGKEVCIGFMPFYHGAGQHILVAALFRGNTLVVVTTPDIDDIITDMLKFGATYFMCSPTMIEMLKDFEKTDRVKWNKLKIILSGADALLEQTAKEWEERTGSYITECFGQTETTTTTHFHPPGHPRYGSIGIPHSNVYSAILDPDKDEFMPVGEIGEIVVDTPALCLGYWRQPAATKDCQSVVNGRTWWRTGDLGKMEADGYFSIYDRKRDLIKYKGLRVYAREVEEVLKEHPHIKEVGVVASPDKVVGSFVKAVIVLRQEARGYTTEVEIREFCKDKLAHYKIPQIIEFAGELPKTDIGKVSRREIRIEEDQK